MKRPYCIIDGTKYQLHEVNDVIRFPDDGREMPDLNVWVKEYIQGKRPLNDLFEYYTNSGCSYWFVWEIFHRFGTNSHTVSQGKEAFKSFTLYRSKETNHDTTT